MRASGRYWRRSPRKKGHWNAQARESMRCRHLRCFSSLSLHPKAHRCDNIHPFCAAPRSSSPQRYPHREQTPISASEFSIHKNQSQWWYVLDPVPPQPLPWFLLPCWSSIARRFFLWRCAWSPTQISPAGLAFLRLLAASRPADVGTLVKGWTFDTLCLRRRAP